MNNVIEIQMGIALSLHITFGNITSLTIFILLIHEHERSFHLLVSCTISFWIEEIDSQFRT
jgi:hypothetical protein